ncbi:TRAP transporter substrate-binding protein DctP [Anaeromicrobium sediminis]|uniref:C4-dicarboxylate ABC transporter n=1 Tax=Anaeromicrobium sediminis TaxID=1478221 RepID=A0A267MLJ0_9FIRM|nr:TRAP transporter substrate-binding protein DctP [Anaeromicrobium sediminis]PAB59640.1 C4-dicarboxylate ABC transporter [Anaeromicrobium sediminis]
MRNVKRIMSILICVVLVIGSLAACSSPASQEGKTMTWKIGHIRPEGAVADKDVRALASAIKESTNGDINIEVYPGSTLGDYQIVQERVGIGDVEMQLAPAGTNVDKALGITAVPYLATNWEEAKHVFRKDGPMMDALGKRFEKQGIKLLSTYPVYFGGIALVKEPNEAGNPNVSKGLKIRVPGMKVYELNAQAQGYLATPIPYSEAFTAMQTGIVDGAIGGGAEGYYASFRDVTKYYLPVNDHFEMWFLYMNMETWEGLSDEQKKTIEDASAKFESTRYELAEKDQKGYEAKLAEAGVNVYEFTQEELTAMAEKARAEVWPKLKDEFGAELFDAIIADIQ